MNDTPETGDSSVPVQPITKSSDGRIFCRRCWRVEYHFHVLPERSKNTYLVACICSLGLAKLIGPYRCRCCGNRRMWAFDVRDAQRSRQGSPRWKKRARTEYEPFRRSFSLMRIFRRGFRSLKRLNPWRKRSGNRSRD
jgi:hypothetical protein